MSSMAGLVPAIHVLGFAKEDVDARVKRGHDELYLLTNPLKNPVRSSVT